MKAVEAPNDKTPDLPLRLVMEAITDYAIYLLDPSGIIVTWNTGAEKITGYDRTEIIGQHFTRLFTPEDLKLGLAENALATAMQTGRFEAEGWRVRKDGSRFWALTVADIVRDESGKLVGFVKILRDMTERRAAEQAIIESERRFRLLVEGVVDYAIYMIDPMGVIVNWNAGAERLKGYTAREIIGQHFSRFYTREDRTAGRPARALQTATQEGRYEDEGWRVRKDGSRFWASVVVDAIRDETGTLIGFAKITRDITERRSAQEALRESERQFRMLVAGVSDYAIFMLDPNGVVSNWNAGAERFKQYRADEIIGQHFSKFYTEADRAAGMPARSLATAIETGKFEAEGWRVRKDGSLFFAHVVIDAIRDETGQLAGFAKITRDITERREAQAALERTREQLAHAQKMEALGKLTGGVAHDFNNLLMIVGGHAHVIRRQAAGDPKILKALDAIETASKRGESLTKQMLGFSRRTPINPTTVNLNHWMGTVRDMLSSPVSGNSRIVISIPANVWDIHVDASEMELALLNLLLNSRDAMPDSGVITLRAENVSLPRRDARTADLHGEFVALSLSDTGVGIPADILPRVFDPFFTTKEVDKGTGLGLSQVYGFALQSAGAVTIDSELGKGTTVTLYLPRAVENAAEEPAAAGDEAAAPVSGLAVLLIEDNPDVAQATANLLEELGHTVRTAPNADAALADLARGEKTDVLLSDVVMPGKMDGIALARAVRYHYPTIAVLLASGYSKAADEAQREFPILRKPYDVSALGQAITRVLARRREGAGVTNLVDFFDAKKSRTAKPD